MRELLPDGPIVRFGRDLDAVCAPMIEALRQDVEQLAGLLRPRT